MPPPPDVGVGLRPAGRGVLPRFLPAQHRPIQQGKIRIHRLQRPVRGEVGVVDLSPVLQEQAQAEALALLRAQSLSGK